VPHEDLVDRQLEEVGEPKGKRQARVVFATLEVPDRLRIDPDLLRELDPAQAGAFAQFRDPVRDRVLASGLPSGYRAAAPAT
jgi:hypothetical protein